MIIVDGNLSRHCQRLSNPEAWFVKH
ncbi:protein of unknown function [Paraburkholderia kururiensis]